MEKPENPIAGDEVAEKAIQKPGFVYKLYRRSGVEDLFKKVFWPSFTV